MQQKIQIPILKLSYRRAFLCAPGMQIAKQQNNEIKIIHT